MASCNQCGGDVPDNTQPFAVIGEKPFYTCPDCEGQAVSQTIKILFAEAIAVEMLKTQMQILREPMVSKASLS